VSGFVGVTALLTGGASGTALAAAVLLATRGARLACLDLAPELLPEPGYGSPVDAHLGRRHLGTGGGCPRREPALEGHTCTHAVIPGPPVAGERVPGRGLAGQ
jgi:NAD(P)-dependent dehydrogenase (short-subunit alcohol dehydrogenase family)